MDRKACVCSFNLNSRRVIARRSSQAQSTYSIHISITTFYLEVLPVGIAIFSFLGTRLTVYKLFNCV